MGKHILSFGVFILFLGITSLGYTEYQAYANDESSFLVSREKIFSPVQKINKKIFTLPSTEELTIQLSLDFTCPYCRKFYKNTFAPLRKQYRSKILFRVTHFPRQSSELSLHIAKFYECASEQKSSWEVLDLLYFGYDSFQKEQEPQWIEKLSLEKEPLQKCMEDEKTMKKILAQKELAQDKSVRGTPTISINTKNFEGNISKEILEMEILKAIAQ